MNANSIICSVSSAEGNTTLVVQRSGPEVEILLDNGNLKAAHSLTVKRQDALAFARSLAEELSKEDQ